MALLHPKSAECMRSELELFKVNGFQGQLKNWSFIDYFPLTSLDRGGPLEFVVKGSSSTYVDLNESLLHLEFRICDENGTNIAAESDTSSSAYATTLVSPVNNFHSSVFRSCEVYINSNLISPNDNLYHYKSYLQNLLSFGSDSKTSYLECGQFFKDSGTLDTFAKTEATVSSSKNKGLTSRFTLSKNSTSFSSVGRIHSDLFLQPKFIPATNEIRLKLHRSDPSFALIAATNSKYTIVIEKARLQVKHFEVLPHIREAHALALEDNNTFKYPLKHVQMKYFTKGSNRNDLSEQNIVNGVLPKKVIFGIVRSENFNGTIQKNPFLFEHHDVSSVSLRMNGHPIPYEELILDYTNNKYTDAYFSLLQASGALYTKNDIGISYSDYKNGYALYGFDLSSCVNDTACTDLIREGNLGLTIRLNSSISYSTTIVVYLEYDKVIEIDKDGNVTSNID